MTKKEFETAILNSIQEGQVFRNPLRGISTIVEINSNRVRYKRGNSIIPLTIGDMYKTYAKYAGKNVSSPDLRTYNPELYDSKQGGHSCHCSFLFLVLIAMGLVKGIQGGGVKGNPFWVHIKP
jgi:hypothetical protein